MDRFLGAFLVLLLVEMVGRWEDLSTLLFSVVGCIKDFREIVGDRVGCLLEDENLLVDLDFTGEYSGSISLSIPFSSSSSFMESS